MDQSIQSPECGDGTHGRLAAGGEALLLAHGVLKAALDCIIAVDGAGCIIEFNPAAEQAFGWSRAEVIGQTMDELIIPPAYRAAHRAGMARYLAGGEARVLGQRLELEAQRRDGSIFPVELSITQVDQGAAPILVAYLRDLTERTAASAKLDEARALLQAFMDHIPTSIYIKRADHTVLHVSKHLAQQYGLPVDDMVGRFEYDLHVPEMQGHLKAMDEHIFATGESILMEGFHSGFQRHEQVSRFPIFNEHGDITHIGGVNFDIDEKTKAQAELTKSKALFEAFIQNAPYPMALMDAAGRHIMVNTTAADYYGEPAETVVQQDARYIVSRWPEFKTVIAPMMAGVLSSHTNQQADTLFELPSGDVRNMATSLFPILGPSGELAFIGMISHDTTEERRAQAEAERASARFEAFFNNAPAAMYIRDLENRVVMVNQWGARMFGRTPNELIGMSATLARRPEDADRIKLVDAELHRTGLPQVEEIMFDLNGQTITGQCTIFPIMDRDGAISQVGALIFDITQERRAQAQLAASQESLHQSEKLAALGQLLAGVAHELNNPLAIVLGRAAILKDKLAGTPHVDSIQKLRDAADRCARIVKTFLAMARQTGPRRAAVQINELVAGALDMTAYGLRTAGIDLLQELDPALPLIDADEDQMVQLLINLIINAQHALQDHLGDRQLVVRTTADVTNRQLVIDVADNGPGVPADLAARIFDPFFTTKAVGEGTGLGLSVCKGMVEAHGGTLTMHSTPGGGATFRATLPMLTTSASASMPDEALAQTSRGRILIVDDEPEIAAILADCLAPLGIDCDIAGDGNAALQRVAANHFDAIFCDVRMPGMDGIALHARLKAEHPALATRLAFVSGDVLHRDVARLKAAAECPIIEKPFDPQLVRDVAIRLLAPEGDTL